MRPIACAYSHQGHGPRADQTGRIHISDFRYPAYSHLQTAAGPYIRVRNGLFWRVEKESVMLSKAEAVGDASTRAAMCQKQELEILIRIPALSNFASS